MLYSARRTRKLVAILLVLTFLLVGFTSLSYGQTEGLMLMLTDDGMSGLPESLTTGIVPITFSNEMEEGSFFPILGRLNEDVTFDAFMEAFAMGEIEALPLVTLLGGVRLAAGADSAATFDFKEGEHIVINFDAMPPDVVHFTAEGEADMAVEAPEADIELTLVDFAFGMPLEIEANGPQVWHIENKGTQWHEMVVVQVEDGTTMETLMPMLEAMLAPPEAPADGSAAGEGEAASEEGPPEIDSAFFWAPIGPDEQAWVEVDLAPGTYAALCFLPDVELGTPHIEHGMVQLITIKEKKGY